ncbi:hypothetical protein J6590_045100 [Homalodisca vitripennis]|nr:hypothetical protein J6590_045100 [Homalodisca vitripennis]
MAELNDSADVFANSSVETIKENFDYTDFVAEARKPPCLPFMDDSRFDDFRGQVFTSSPISPQNQILPDADNISFIANQFVSEACNKEKRQLYQSSSPVFKPNMTPPKNPCEKTTSFFTKFHLEHDGVSPLTTNHFKCGLCYEDFENNAQLLNHLQCQHKGLSLSAQYRCGACNAKFYRNSYLVRHCWFHHTPLCLKTNGQSDDK